MPQTQRQVELLDACDLLMRETQEPIHYKQLCEILIQSGLWQDPWGKKPDQCLYSALHNDVKRTGQGAGRFLFMGGGVFCTSFVEALDELTPMLPVPSSNVSQRDAFARTGDMPGDADRRREAAEAAEANRRCGNCTHLWWHGPNIHTHEVGSCSQYSKTRRPCVFRSSEACECWARRTTAQANSDRSLPIELHMEAEHIRITGSRPRNSRLG